MPRLLLAVLLVSSSLVAQQATSPTKQQTTSPTKSTTPTARLKSTGIKPRSSGGGAYYPPCVSPDGITPCHSDLGHTTPPGSCTNRCTNGPARLTPGPTVLACAGKDTWVNLRVDGDALSNHGDAVIYSGVNIDWGDGKAIQNIPVMTPDEQHWTTNINKCHQYIQAGEEYDPSVLYFIQHKYDGAGSCSYECHLTAQTHVVVKLANDPACRAAIATPQCAGK